MTDAGSRSRAQPATPERNPWLFGMGLLGGIISSIGLILVVVGREKPCGVCDADWSVLTPVQIIGLVVLFLGVATCTAAMVTAAVFWEAEHRK